MSCGYPCPSREQHIRHPKRASDMRQGWTTPTTGRFGARLASEMPRHGNEQCLGCCLRSSISRICRHAEAFAHAFVTNYCRLQIRTWTGFLFPGRMSTIGFDPVDGLCSHTLVTRVLHPTSRIPGLLATHGRAFRAPWSNNQR